MSFAHPADRTTAVGQMRSQGRQGRLNTPEPGMSITRGVRANGVEHCGGRDERRYV
jgi:hypothetical protein